MPQTTFTFMGNEDIADIILHASDCVIFAAPSFSENIAESIRENTQKLQIPTQRIIIDANAESFRLGFGEFKGLKEIAELGVDIRKAPGLRIGVLVVDENAWVFSPTPEIIFDQPDEKTFNAVRVSRDFAEQILAALAPEFSAYKKPASDDETTSAEKTFDPSDPFWRLRQPNEPSSNDILDSPILADPKDPEIGSKPVTVFDLREIEKELEIAPPQQFDLKRQVNVYNSYYQFVEIKLSNFNLSAFTIPVSEQLVAIVDDAEVRRRLSAKYKLLEADSKIKKDLKGITDAVNDLREDFTTSMKVGRLLAKEEKQRFEKKVEEIQTFITKATGEIENELTTEIETNCRKLAKVLLPIVVENRPRYLHNRLLGNFSDEERISKVLVAELMPSETSIKKLIDGMKLETSYKDITYEMLNDEEFVNRIKELNPSKAEIFEEGPALKAKKASNG